MSVDAVVMVVAAAVLGGVVRLWFSRLERRMDGIEAMALRVEVLHERVSGLDRVVREVEGDLDHLRLAHERMAGRCSVQ